MLTSAGPRRTEHLCCVPVDRFFSFLFPYVRVSHRLAGGMAMFPPGPQHHARHARRARHGRGGLVADAGHHDHDANVPGRGGASNVANLAHP